MHSQNEAQRDSAAPSRAFPGEGGAKVDARFTARTNIDFAGGTKVDPRFTGRPQQ